MMKTKTLFSTRKVLDGALSLVNYMVYFYWSFDIDKYHEEVTTEVKDEKVN
jgi:hypothetical protein